MFPPPCCCPGSRHFSEDEFLHVAQITESSEKQKQVYETTLKYYPMSKIAANNLAILLEKEGKVDVAEITE